MISRSDISDVQRLNRTIQHLQHSNNYNTLLKDFRSEAISHVNSIDDLVIFVIRLIHSVTSNPFACQLHIFEGIELL
jgi:hypothetical protein